MREEFMKAIDICIEKCVTVTSTLPLNANGYYIVTENDVHCVSMKNGDVHMTTIELIEYANSL